MNIRVERLDETLDATNVRQAGTIYSATLVLWGQYDAVGITPYVERIRALHGGRTDEEGQNLLVDQERMQFSIVTDLPAMSSYLVFFTLGSDANTNQQWDEAINYLTSAINAIPATETTAKPDEAYFERGLAYNALGNFQGAIGDFTTALDAGFADTARLHFHRGLAYGGLSDYQGAIDDFTTALDEGFGNVALLYHHRGLAYNGRGNYTEAIEDFQQTLSILDSNDQPLRPEAEYWLQEAEANLDAELSNR